MCPKIQWDGYCANFFFYQLNVARQSQKAGQGCLLPLKAAFRPMKFHSRVGGAFSGCGAELSFEITCRENWNFAFMAGFAEMPSASLECPYEACVSRYNAISAHLTSSQNLQLIFLTWMDAYAPASISYPVPPLSHGTPVTPCFCTAPVPCSEEKIQHDYRTDKDRFIGKCMAPDCPWHING